jgi:hypothetical protein
MYTKSNKSILKEYDYIEKLASIIKIVFMILHKKTLFLPILRCQPIMKDMIPYIVISKADKIKTLLMKEEVLKT